MGLFLRCLFFGLFVSFIFGCGDGQVSIQTTVETAHLIQPEPLLLQLEKISNDRKATSLQLAKLHEKSMFKFDWNRFWHELSERSFRFELYQYHKEELSRLNGCVNPQT